MIEALTFTAADWAARDARHAHWKKATALEAATAALFDAAYALIDAGRFDEAMKAVEAASAASRAACNSEVA